MALESEILFQIESLRFFSPNRFPRDHSVLHAGPNRPPQPVQPYQSGYGVQRIDPAQRGIASVASGSSSGRSKPAVSAASMAQGYVQEHEALDHSCKGASLAGAKIQGSAPFDFFEHINSSIF